eukprot:8947114-Pyramimonas_sp.AAC.1
MCIFGCPFSLRSALARENGVKSPACPRGILFAQIAKVPRISFDGLGESDCAGPPKKAAAICVCGLPGSFSPALAFSA